MSKKQQIQKTTSLLGYDSNNQQKQVYIYAYVDIDKLYGQITSKSRRISKFLQQNNLQIQFIQKMREYKHLRICFDNQIQQFIYKKQLNKQLKNVKKNVFVALQQFLVSRFNGYLQQQRLHRQYNEKVQQIQGYFSKRLEQLTKQYL